MKSFSDEKILGILQEKQYLSVDEFASCFNVSPSTIRRKLAQLEESGLILRVRGGAKLNDENYYPKFSFRSHLNSYEKKKIALSAIKLIKSGDVIFLDGSTTSFFIAEYLSQFKNIKVFTNGIDTLMLLSKFGVNAYSTGGNISTENPSVLVGSYAEKIMSDIRPDICFFSAHSVNKEGEIFDCFEMENPLRLLMIKNSKTSVFLCDQTKFGNVSPFKLCSVNDVDYIVCDVDKKDFFTSSIKANFMHL